MRLELIFSTMLNVSLGQLSSLSKKHFRTDLGVLLRRVIVHSFFVGVIEVWIREEYFFGVVQSSYLLHALSLALSHLYRSNLLDVPPQR